MAQTTQISTQLTSAAKAFIRRMCRFAVGPEAGFQLKVAPGGCSGFATAFDLVGRPEAGDLVWEYEGLRIFLASESRKFLDNATLDFVETLSHTGFVVRTKGATPAACSSISKLVSIESLIHGPSSQNRRASHGAVC
jgi:iron-sulfur cluster assembly accessory protein